jgi:gamma-glutamylcyclotransferase
MCTGRLKQRVPSATARFAAALGSHRLTFSKRSKDGSGKCDAQYTGDERDFVWGVVFELLNLEKKKLDEAEGLGFGYLEKAVTVSGPEGEDVATLTYYASEKDESLRPYSWYLRFVVDGAKQHGLPLEYLSTLVASDCIEDPNRHRDWEMRTIQCCSV